MDASFDVAVAEALDGLFEQYDRETSELYETYLSDLPWWERRDLSFEDWCKARESR